MQKSLIVFMFFSLFFMDAFSLKPLITKSISNPYSGISGRRYHIPRESAPTLPTHELQYSNVMIIPDDYESATLIADERNRELRDKQLLRTSNRVYGTYGYHNTAITQPHR